MKSALFKTSKELQITGEKKPASKFSKASKFFTYLFCATSIMYGSYSYSQGAPIGNMPISNRESSKNPGIPKPTCENSVSLSGATVRAIFSGQDTTISFEGQLEEKFGFKSFPSNTIIDTSVAPSGETIFFIMAPESKSIISIYKSQKTRKVSSLFLSSDDGIRMGEKPLYTILPKGGIFAVSDNFTFLYFDPNRAFFFRPKDIFSKFGAPNSGAKVRAFYEDGELVVIIDSKNLVDGPIEFLPNLLLWRYMGKD